MVWNNKYIYILSNTLQNEYCMKLMVTISGSVFNTIKYNIRIDLELIMNIYMHMSTFDNSISTSNMKLG